VIDPFQVDESMVTGEPLPVLKQVDDAVVGGTVNFNMTTSAGSTSQQGMLLIEANRVGHQTTLSQIIEMVESAQNTKPPIQNIADRISGYFVPIILLLFVVTFTAWMLALKYSDLTSGTNMASHLFNATFMSQAASSMQVTDFLLVFVALRVAISVIVVACPCALGLATPTAVMVGTGVGAKLGILIKSTKSFEKAKRVTHIVFDKTGTLTRGRPFAVNQILTRNDEDVSDRAFRLAYAILSVAESNSEHPIAKAIVEKSRTLNTKKGSLFFSEHEIRQFVSTDDQSKGSEERKLKVDLIASNFQSTVGSGIQCEVKLLARNSERDTKPSMSLCFRVYAGNKAWLQRKQIGNCNNSILRNFALSASEEGQSIIYAAIELDTTRSKGLSSLPRERSFIVGAIALMDEIKEESSMVVEVLKKRMGCQVFMATGDQWETARAVAARCGIDQSNVFAELSPGEKKSMVESLQFDGVVHDHESGLFHLKSSDENQIPLLRSNLIDPALQKKDALKRPILLKLSEFVPSIFRDKVVSRSIYHSFSGKRNKPVIAFIGDGINDSPALAQADVGIALCSGTDVAMEAANIVIMNRQNKTDSRLGNMCLIPVALDLSKTIYRRILLNFAWATVYNLIALPAAMGLFVSYGLTLNPAIAAGMMALSSVSVVVSSLALRLYRPPTYPPSANK
jgi:Cu+-exporting ATPase